MWRFKALVHGLTSGDSGCPYCFSSGVRPSLQARRLARTFGLESFVCRECYRHFMMARVRGAALSADGPSDAAHSGSDAEGLTASSADVGHLGDDVEEPTPTIELPKPQPLSAEALRSLDEYFAKHCHKAQDS